MSVHRLCAVFRVAPDPSVGRTSSGKPEDAAHVERDSSRNGVS